MTEVANSYILNLYSSQRSGGTPSNAYYSLPSLITLSRDDTRFRMKVIKASIPYTFNQLNSNFNTVGYTLTRGMVSTSGIITIPPGNYSINTLLTQLDTLLTNEIETAIPGWYVLNSQYLSFSYDRNTMLATFAVYDTVPIFLSLLFGSNLTLGRFFGCNQTKSFTENTSVTSDFPVNVSPARSIFVKSDTFQQSSNYEAITSVCRPSNILAEITINCQPTYYIQYEDFNSNGFRYITNQNFKELHIYLTDTQSDTPLVILNDVLITLVIEEVIIPRLPVVTNPLLENKDYIQQVSKITDDLSSLDELIHLQNELRDLRVKLKGKKRREPVDPSSLSLEIPSDSVPTDTASSGQQIAGDVTNVPKQTTERV